MEHIRPYYPKNLRSRVLLPKILTGEVGITRPLPFDFIIENLDEKNNIYRLACEAFGVRNPEWLITQQMNTIAYYINSRRLGILKYLKLRRWIKANGGEVSEELLALTAKRYRGK